MLLSNPTSRSTHGHRRRKISEEGFKKYILFEIGLTLEKMLTIASLKCPALDPGNRD